ncbi:MAG: hypothetical protein ACRD5G_15270 [Candidatus Acidiferrales bacterium]
MTSETQNAELRNQNSEIANSKFQIQNYSKFQNSKLKISDSNAVAALAAACDGNGSRGAIENKAAASLPHSKSCARRGRASPHPPTAPNDKSSGANNACKMPAVPFARRWPAQGERKADRIVDRVGTGVKKVIERNSEGRRQNSERGKSKIEAGG